MKSVVILLFCCLWFSGCDSLGRKDFYSDLAGWDWIVVPAIKPYKAASTDHGEHWYLNLDTSRGAIPVFGFGVSQNLIFGKGGDGWFFYDTRSHLLAKYASRDELDSSLQSLHIPREPMSRCQAYYERLSEGKRCYWYPPAGEKYPVYPALSGPDTNEIWVSDSLREQPVLRFDTILRSHPNKIYFFKVNYDGKKSDSSYLSFGFSPPVLITDGMVVPVFADKKEIKVDLSEGNRVIVTKQVSLRP
jgi:hypothetical protein